MPLVELQLHGASVRIVRAVRNMTQIELARQTGLSQAKIWQIENGVRKPTAEQWAKIWGALTTE